MCFSFWGTSAPSPLPGVRPWTPLGTSIPRPSLPPLFSRFAYGPALRTHRHTYALEVCGSTRTRGYTRPDTYPQVWVGYGYEIHGYGYTRFYP